MGQIWEEIPLIIFKKENGNEIIIIEIQTYTQINVQGKNKKWWDKEKNIQMTLKKIKCMRKVNVALCQISK